MEITLTTSNNEGTFEKRLDQLEALVKQMEEGGLQLDELMAVYERGTQLSQALGRELEKAQTRLQQLKGGELLPMPEAADDV